MILLKFVIKDLTAKYTKKAQRAQGVVPLPQPLSEGEGRLDV